MSSKVTELYRKELLYHLVGKGFPENYRKGSIIDCPCEHANHIFLVKQGYLRQYFTNQEGSEKTLLLLERGDIFGEITHFQNDSNQVITKVLMDSKLERIPVKTFDAYGKVHPELYYYIGLIVSTKVRILMAQIHDASYCDAEERLKNLLIRLSCQHGEVVESGIRINYNFTHEELAQMISSTRSTVSRKLKALERKGIIVLKKSIIVKHTEI